MRYHDCFIKYLHIYYIFYYVLNKISIRYDTELLLLYPLAGSFIMFVVCSLNSGIPITNIVGLFFISID